LTGPTGGVSVVVPTLDAGRARRIARSLARQTLAHEAIIVDNGCSDRLAMPALREIHPAVEVVRLERNQGYSRAVNLAARQAQGEVLVLVNDDCELEATFLAEIAGALDPGRGVVMSAGVLRDARLPTLIDTAGVQIDSTLLAVDYLNGKPLAALDSAPAPLGPSAGAAAVDRAAFFDVGCFDEALFAYYEDVDLALRLREAGGDCALVRTALGTHDHSATLGSGSARKDYLMGFGRGYVLRKWSVASLGRLPGIVLRDLVICLGQAVVDRNVAGVRGRARGFRASRRAHPYPAGLIRLGHGYGALETLWRQARRRRRVRGTIATRDGDSSPPVL